MKPVAINPSKARRAAEAYLAAMNAHDAAALADLFAPDGVMLLPTGAWDRDRIRNIDMAGVTEHFLVNVAEQGNTCVLELEAHPKDAPDQIRRAKNIIEVETDGKITHLSVC